MDIKIIVENLIDAFLSAGKLSLFLRDKGLTKEIKSDNTPVSNGDLEVNKFITDKISNITPDIPIISEETTDNKDNKTLNNLVLSSTDLYPKCKTTGHAHVGQEEVYTFVRGSGKMEMIDTNGKHHDTNVKEGDIVLIPDGWFHRVHAGPTGCYFVCVFDGKRNH